MTIFMFKLNINFANGLAHEDCWENVGLNKSVSQVVRVEIRTSRPHRLASSRQVQPFAHLRL